MKTIRKSLFKNSPKEHYTDEASKFDSEVARALGPIFEKYVALGYSVRELAYAASQAVMDVHLNILIDKQSGR